MTEFTFIDLFAGIGGFRRALESIGGKCLGYSEIAPDAIKTYCENYGDSESDNFGDITKLKTLPLHDFMTGGVPCQSWSIAGRNLGFDDDRGQLWNDTIYLLNKVRPKAFIFENVKGLADPRNADALAYILRRIKEAGYTADKYLLDSHDYGVPQHRERIYIVGFRDAVFAEKFKAPAPVAAKATLRNVLDGIEASLDGKRRDGAESKPRWGLSSNENGMNDYFLFNDIRDGKTTIHSWDIEDTTSKEKGICRLILKNRRKKVYGVLDGNPLSEGQIHALDSGISAADICGLVKKGILQEEKYVYEIRIPEGIELSDDESAVTDYAHEGGSPDGTKILNVGELHISKRFRGGGPRLASTLRSLENKGAARCIEVRYDFKNRKISTGLNGINRIFLPASDTYSTMVASDSNDYVATADAEGRTPEEYKRNFLDEIYAKHKYRRITKEEACRMQGFPADFKLPGTRSRWMKLIGNSVSVPVIRLLAEAVADTGVFDAEAMDTTT